MNEYRKQLAHRVRDLKRHINILELEQTHTGADYTTEIQQLRTDLHKLEQEQRQLEAVARIK